MRKVSRRPRGKVARRRLAGRPSLLARAGDLCGCLDSGVTDLATNPKHLEGFGTWAR